MIADKKQENKPLKNMQEMPKEYGGPKGLEPTRYGVDTPEWEVKSRVSDF